MMDFCKILLEVRANFVKDQLSAGEVCYIHFKYAYINNEARVAVFYSMRTKIRTFGYKGSANFIIPFQLKINIPNIN